MKVTIKFKLGRWLDNIFMAAVYGFFFALFCRVAYKFVMWAFT